MSSSPGHGGDTPESVLGAGTAPADLYPAGSALTSCDNRLQGVLSTRGSGSLVRLGSKVKIERDGEREKKNVQTQTVHYYPNATKGSRSLTFPLLPASLLPVFKG